MSKKKKVMTPWINNNEWMQVYHHLFSSNMDHQRWAVNRICVWRVRSLSKLPSAIDATEALVRVKLETPFISPSSNTLYDTSNITMLYSMALIRFAKLISEIGQKRGLESVTGTAKVLKIPHWVVELRHDVTHSIVPPISMLEKGVDFALNWIKWSYWEKFEKQIMDTLDDDIKNDDEESCIRKLMDCFCQQRYKNPGDIKINGTIRKLSNQNICTVSKILTENGYLLSTEQQLFNILNDEELVFLNNESTELPKSLLNFWLPILKIYDTEQKLYWLVDCLLLSQSDLLLHKRLIAAWIITLNSSKKIEKSTVEKYNCKIKIPQLDWSLVLKNALLCGNEYSPAYLPLILENMSVDIPDDKKQDLMALVAIKLGKTVASTSNSPRKYCTSKIHTVSDLQKAKLLTSISENMLQTDLDIIEENEVRWKICTDNICWEKWPIGFIPEISSVPEENSYSAKV